MGAVPVPPNSDDPPNAEGVLVLPNAGEDVLAAPKVGVVEPNAGVVEPNAGVVD